MNDKEKISKEQCPHCKAKAWTPVRYRFIAWKCGTQLNLETGKFTRSEWCKRGELAPGYSREEASGEREENAQI